MNKESEVMGWIMIICAGIVFGAGVDVILSGEPISAVAAGSLVIALSALICAVGLTFGDKR